MTQNGILPSNATTHKATLQCLNAHTGTFDEVLIMVVLKAKIKCQNTILELSNFGTHWRHAVSLSSLTAWLIL